MYLSICIWLYFYTSYIIRYILYAQFKYSYRYSRYSSNILRDFLFDFLTKLQMVNTSVDTHVNHPWLRLRRVFSRLSLLRGDPL